MNRIKSKHIQQGLAAIEFTIILPFFIITILATAEFGRLLYQYSALNQTVRDASRYLSSNARYGSDAFDSIPTVVQSNFEKLVKYGDIGTTTPRLPNLDASTINLTINGELITISVSYPWQPIFATSMPRFYGTDLELSFPLISNYTVRVL